MLLTVGSSAKAMNFRQYLHVQPVFLREDPLSSVAEGEGLYAAAEEYCIEDGENDGGAVSENSLRTCVPWHETILQ